MGKFAGIVGLLVLASSCTATRRSGTPPTHEVYVPLVRADGTPLSPLALAGRDVFLREGCQVCHTVASPGKRTEARVPDEEVVAVPAVPSGPSLRGVGGRYVDLWHVLHLRDPRLVTAGSTMPSFAAPLAEPLAATTPERVTQLRTWLDPDAPRDVAQTRTTLRNEAETIAAEVVAQGGDELDPYSRLVAVVAYVQQLDREPPPGPPPAPGPAYEAVGDEALRSLSPERRARGAVLFAQHCAPCHGKGGHGVIGPDLTDDTWEHGGRPSEVLRSIAEGHPAHGMPAWAGPFTDEELQSVTAHVLHLGAETH